jgi:PhoH-like ATPase
LNTEIREIFSEDNSDHWILSVAYDLHKKASSGNRNAIVLVTKDVNMRMKAKELGIRAEDYSTDREGRVPCNRRK